MGSVLTKTHTGPGEDPESSSEVGEWVRGVKGYQPASVSKLRHQLHWLTLLQRRGHQRLPFRHKIMSGEVGITKEMLGLEDSDSRIQKNRRFKLKPRKGGQINWNILSSVAPSQSGFSSPPLWQRLPQTRSSRGSWLFTCPRQPQPWAQWSRRFLSVLPRPRPRPRPSLTINIGSCSA